MSGREQKNAYERFRMKILLSFQRCIESVIQLAQETLVRIESLFVVILAVILLRERINKRILVSLALALTGSLLVSFTEIPVLSLSNLLIIGFLLAISAGFLFALSMIIAKRLIVKLSPINMIALRAIIGSFFVFNPQGYDQIHFFQLFAIAGKLDFFTVTSDQKS